MKVTHLLTSGTGGAALAAIRLSEALIAEGIDSQCVSVVRRKHKSSPGIYQQEISKFSQFTSSAVTAFQSAVVQKSANPVSPITLDLLDWNDPLISEADVIHLHAFFNLASIKNFLQKYPNKAKVVTFHDERFFSGGCHQSLGCENIASSCVKCPQVHAPFRSLINKVQKTTSSIVGSNSKVIFVAPSKWIMERSKLAFPSFPQEKFVNIYNPVPSSFLNDIAAETKQSQIQIGFISQNLNNPIKNLHLLIKSFEELQKIHPNRYRLKLIGESNTDYTHLQGVSQHMIENINDMQGALAMMDLLVVPSTHDNLPNVLGEALMHGVSVIGSSVGGIPEICKLFNMPIIHPDSPKELIQAIQNFKRPNKQELRRQASEVFGYKTIATKMIEQYKFQTN